MVDALPNSFSYRLASERGLSDRRLRALVAEGAIERFGYGVYRKSDAPPADLDRVELALRAPDATLCLATALAQHDLTDAIPATIDVALPRAQRPPKVGAPVRWHRFDQPTFYLGRELMQVDDGVFIGVYNDVRSIVDAFRMRHQEGEESAVEALRRWLKQPTASPARLLAMARHFPKAEPSLLHALRILT